MQNFGKIKNAFNGILADGMVSKNDINKLLFKKYIHTIRESDILRTQFLVYNNIESKIEDDAISANIFLSENLKLLQKFKVSDIIKENEKLIALAKDIKLDEAYDPALSSLHESLSNLMLTKVTPRTVDEVTKNMTNVVSYMKTNKVKPIVEAIDLPPSMLSQMMVDKYNKTYASLDETEKSVLKVLIESNDEQKKEVYSTTLRECIDLIDEKLKGADLEAKDKLLRVKDKLLNDKKEITEEFAKNISRLVELKSSLKNN
jgi:hypothetical protein